MQLAGEEVSRLVHRPSSSFTPHPCVSSSACRSDSGGTVFSLSVVWPPLFRMRGVMDMSPGSSNSYHIGAVSAYRTSGDGSNDDSDRRRGPPGHGGGERVRARAAATTPTQSSSLPTRGGGAGEERRDDEPGHDSGSVTAGTRQWPLLLLATTTLLVATLAVVAATLLDPSSPNPSPLPRPELLPSGDGREEWTRSFLEHAGPGPESCPICPRGLSWWTRGLTRESAAPEVGWIRV